MEELTIKGKLDRIIEREEEKKVKKKFSLPFMIRMMKGKIKKRNYAVVMLVKMNGSVDIKFVPIEDNTIRIADTYHEATADYVLRYKRYPMIILPEWNLKPFSPRENVKEAIEEGSLSSAEKFIINKIEMERVKKTKINPKAIGVIILVIIIGYFVLSSMGWV